MKVGQHKSPFLSFLVGFSLHSDHISFLILTLLLLFVLFFLFQFFQSSTSSSRREPKLQRWPLAYRRPPVATLVWRREPPAARSQTGQRTLCLPCRPLTLDSPPPSTGLRPDQLSSITRRQTDLTLKHTHLRFLIHRDTVHLHYRDLYMLCEEKKGIIHALR